MGLIAATVVASSGAPLHIPGALSPHELVHKLQLVQQEQSQAPQEAPRLGPALAPRFQVPSSVAAAAPKAALQFQVGGGSNAPQIQTRNLKTARQNTPTARDDTGVLRSGAVSAEDPRHCGPDVAPLPQLLLSGEIGRRIAGRRRRRARPVLICLPWFHASEEKRSSVEKPAPGNLTALDPGMTPPQKKKTHTHLCDILIYSRRTAPSWTPSTRLTSGIFANRLSSKDLFWGTGGGTKT